MVKKWKENQQRRGLIDDRSIVIREKITGFPKDNKEENQQLSRKMKLRSKGCTEKMFTAPDMIEKVYWCTALLERN